MRHPENRVDQLGIGRPEIQFQQRRLHGVQRLEALLEERIVELREIERHANTAPSPIIRAVTTNDSEAPVHSMPRPAARRSRMNVVSTCSPAVSMRRIVERSRVTLAGF